MTRQLPVPSGLADLTADWLTFALREGGVLGAGEVDSVAASVIGEDLGFSGVIARLRLTYSRAGAGPDSIVAKLPTAERPTESSYRRRAAAVPELQQALAERASAEVSFYREIGALGDVPVPAMLYGAADPQRETVVLLLEDMGDARQADLLAGLSLEEVRAVLQAMAGLHARWWDRAAAMPGWMPTWGADASERHECYSQWVAPFLERYGGALPTGAAQVVERLTTDYQLVLGRLGAAPPTIIHGDLHADNVLLRDQPAGPPTAIVLDWQSVARGPAAVDLALLLVGSMTTVARRAHERTLLGEYWRLIVERGVTGYSRADQWRDYSRATAWLLAGTVGWLAMVDPASISGRERLILECQISEPRVFEAALDHAT